MNNGYVQTRCPRCGNAAWGHPSQGVPCNSCGMVVGPVQAGMPAPAPAPTAPQGWGQPAMPPGMQGMGMGGAPGMSPPGMQGMGAPGMSPPGMQGMGAPGMSPPGMGTPPPGMQVAPGQANPWTAPVVTHQDMAGPKPGIQLPGGFKLPFNVTGGGGISKLKIFGGIALAIVLGIGGVIFKMKFKPTPKGMISYSAASLDKGKPDADKAISQLGGFARKWKKDAIFWSANFLAVRTDGTVDVSKGAEVVYTSPGNSASYAKSQRSDSVKKYRLTASGINGKDKYGWNDPIKDMEAHPTPKCQIKDVMALLVKDGLPAGKTVRVTFDPKFADFYAWRVMSEDPPIDAHYAWEDCSIIK